LKDTYIKWHLDIVGNLWQLTVMVKVNPGEPKMSNITNFFLEQRECRTSSTFFSFWSISGNDGTHF